MRLRSRFEESRDDLKRRHGGRWLLVGVALVAYNVLLALEHIEFSMTHRKGLKAFGVAALRVIVNPATSFFLLVGLLLWLVWLYFFSPVRSAATVPNTPFVEDHRPSKDRGFPNWRAGNIVKPDRVELWAKSTDASELELRCRVQDKDGHIYKSLAPILSPHASPKSGRWDKVFPSDFGGDPPERPASGHHIVNWIAGINDVLVGPDEFDVPEPGDHITRKETVYEEDGRVAGEEIVHGSGRRDANVMPETVGLDPPQVALDPPAREMAGVSPEDLMRAHTELTPAQVHKLAEPYISKWMKVTSTIRNIGAWNGTFSPVFAIQEGIGEVAMYFRAISG
jgi:hypothetical protein